MRGAFWLRSTSLGMVLAAATLVPGPVSAPLAQTQVKSNEYDALGRLRAAQTTGGVNDGDARSLCYDAAGNREKLRASTDSSVVTCSSPAPTPTPTPTSSPTPTPTPTSSNNPPVTQSNYVGVKCGLSKTVNLTSNDTDPEGNYPLALQSITWAGGADASATIVSGSSVVAYSGSTDDVTTLSYTVADSLGATATGQLTISTTLCSGNQ